jgi:hypothetical protein
MRKTKKLTLSRSYELELTSIEAWEALVDEAHLRTHEVCLAAQNACQRAQEIRLASQKVRQETAELRQIVQARRLSRAEKSGSWSPGLF